jgi:hypothetical protein
VHGTQNLVVLCPWILSLAVKFPSVYSKSDLPIAKEKTQIGSAIHPGLVSSTVLGYLAIGISPRRMCFYSSNSVGATMTAPHSHTAPYSSPKFLRISATEKANHHK